MKEKRKKVGFLKNDNRAKFLDEELVYKIIKDS